MIFKQCIETGVFPSEQKKVNIVPIHKNGDKQNGNKTQNGISGNLRNLLEDFLKERKQRVVLNEQVSAQKNINAGVPQVPNTFLK